MPAFGERSLKALGTCHPKLQLVFFEVVKEYDCSVLEGHRGEARQELLFSEGKTTLHYPHSRHNKSPSIAADVVPYPVGWGTDWEDAYTKEMIYFAGFVLGYARKFDTELRWGGDWDRDWELRDNRFNDYPHFELIP